MIQVCVPVLKRYDLLRNLLVSLEQSDLRPGMTFVIDNGQNRELLLEAVKDLTIKIDPISPPKPMGLAETWNWFIRHTHGERIITNDDIVFAPQSLGLIYAATAPFVSCTFGFSCFLLRDECVEKVGYFDEKISPGYAYFEDMDYLRRMKLAGVRDDVVEADVLHLHSQTPAVYTDREWQEHHRKFLLAKANYTKKWAEEPVWEELKIIGGAGANA